MSDEKTAETKAQDIIIDGPNCVPMVISIKNSKNGVAIAIRMGAGSCELPAFGVKPKAAGGIQAMDGDPAGGPGGGC